MQSRRWDILIAAVVVTLFGLLTVLSGGRALFGGSEARAAVGDAVLFVLWFNFLAGFAYVAAGIGLMLQTNWAVKLSIAILIATILVMIAFGVHVLLGGAYEMRTVWAMSLRTVVWGVIVGLAIRDPDGLAPEQLEERH
ncbi:MULTISPECIES: hypothetical protein [Paracoccus]|uniref:Uncharacterized protein n=1 Tax=Paracoccus thiocyanatus TaxID=34006 RepID=A0A1N6WEF2_9RHOB|nr:MULTISPECIES: hypothetical protein [Paracoccus]SIQ88507.1 hypothetical protein SAMN05421641_11677 [Paracoccus thiocyanatus]